MREDDEDVFVSFFAVGGINESFLDFCKRQVRNDEHPSQINSHLAQCRYYTIKTLTRVIHIQIPSQHPPQDPLKHRHPIPLDRSRHELQIDSIHSRFSWKSTEFSSVFEKRSGTVLVAIVREGGSNFGLTMFSLWESVWECDDWRG